MTECNKSNRLGLESNRDSGGKEWLTQLINDLITTLFVEQPLATPGMANYVTSYYFFWGCIPSANQICAPLLPFYKITKKGIFYFWYYPHIHVRESVSPICRIFLFDMFGWCLHWRRKKNNNIYDHEPIINNKKVVGLSSHVFGSLLNPGEALIIQYSRKFLRWCFESWNIPLFFFVNSKSQRKSKLHNWFKSYGNIWWFCARLTPPLATSEILTQLQKFPRFYQTASRKGYVHYVSSVSHRKFLMIPNSVAI